MKEDQPAQHEHEPILPQKGRMFRLLRLGGSILLAGFLFLVAAAWLVSMIPDPKVEPAPMPPSVSRMPNVIPPLAKLPWTRQITQAGVAPITPAVAPWRREIHDSPNPAHVASASSAWMRRTSRAKRVDLAPANLPWPNTGSK